MSEEWGHGGKFEPFDSQRMDNGQPFELGWGEHPHGRQDNKMYARFPDGRIEDFDGHRIRTHVELRTFNYLKCSGLSGNEVRKGGQFRIYLNDRLVWAEFIREADYGLLKCHQRLSEILDCSFSHWGEPEIGRAIYYDRTPAFVQGFECDQNESHGNRLRIASVNGPFPKPVWMDEDEEHEPRTIIITNTLDKEIWWFRDTKAAPAASLAQGEP